MKQLTKLQQAVIDAIAGEMSEESAAMFNALIAELMADNQSQQPDIVFNPPIGGPLNIAPQPGTLTIGEWQEAVRRDPELSAALDDLIKCADEQSASQIELSAPTSLQPQESGETSCQPSPPQLKYPDPNVPHRSTNYSIEQLVKVWGLMMGGVERSEIRSMCNLTERNQSNIEKTLKPYLSCANLLTGSDRYAYVKAVSDRFSAKETVTPANVDPPRSASTDQATTKGPSFPFGTGTSNKIVEFIRQNPDITPAECYRKLLETDRAQYVHGNGDKLTEAWQDYKELAEVVTR